MHKGHILIRFLVYKVKFLFLVAHPLALSHLLNVVHAYQNPISPLIEDDQLFSQLLLIVHGSRSAEPVPRALASWCREALESSDTSAPGASPLTPGHMGLVWRWSHESNLYWGVYRHICKIITENHYIYLKQKQKQTTEQWFQFKKSWIT